MHFPSKDIAKSLNMKVESPFLNEDVIKFSDSIPISRKINVKENKKYGKWILRETFEKIFQKISFGERNHPCKMDQEQTI